MPSGAAVMSSTAELLGIDTAGGAPAGAQRGPAAIRAALDALPGDLAPALSVCERLKSRSGVFYLDGEPLRAHLDLLADRMADSVLARLDVRGALHRGEAIDPLELECWQRDALAVARPGGRVLSTRAATHRELCLDLLASLWIGEHAHGRAFTRLRALLAAAGADGLPLPRAIRVSRAFTWHALADERSAACGVKSQGLWIVSPVVGIDRFGHIDCRSCARRLGAAQRESLDLDVLIYWLEQRMASSGDHLKLLRAEEPGELRERVFAQEADFAVAEITELCLGGVDRTLCRALYGRELDQSHFPEARELLARALDEDDAEAALAELRRRAGRL